MVLCLAFLNKQVHGRLLCRRMAVTLRTACMYEVYILVCRYVHPLVRNATLEMPVSGPERSSGPYGISDRASPQIRESQQAEPLGVVRQQVVVMGCCICFCIYG